MDTSTFDKLSATANDFINNNLQYFSKHDWNAFAGAENFNNGKLPLIGTVTILYSGVTDGYTEGVVILDKVGITVAYIEGDLEFGIPRELFYPHTSGNPDDARAIFSSFFLMDAVVEWLGDDSFALNSYRLEQHGFKQAK